MAQKQQQKMLINAQEQEELRIAIVTDGHLEEYYVEAASREQTRGNIYKGVVDNVEPSLQAAFISYGGPKNGFLQIGEIHPEYYPDDVKGRQPPIRKILRKGDVVLVQVTKEPAGTKGAALTTYISLAGPSLVLMPGRSGSGGVSRQIEDEQERTRLKKILNDMTIPEHLGLILRTRAQGKSKAAIKKDMAAITRLWEEIRSRIPEAPAPSLIHKEEDMALRTIRDHFSSDISEILVDDKELYNKIKAYIKVIAPRSTSKIKLYKEKRPIFSKYELERQIESIHQEEVRLPSGGAIVIHPTEALIAIDVNSGRATKAKDIEETAHRINIEAAAETARQLRLRDLGGLVVIDFIDMREDKHKRAVVKAFKDASKSDKARMRVGTISRFGMLELSRQRIRPPIEYGMYLPCPHCRGRGVIRSPEASALTWLRKIQQGASAGRIGRVEAVLPTDAADYLLNNKREELINLEQKYNLDIYIQSDPFLPSPGGEIEFISREEEDGA